MAHSQPESGRSSEDFIVELDGKLRSGRLGHQCEAIVSLPAVFASHPFPTLVNAVFLKMAEFFRTGSNLLRLCIVKVTEQCKEHLRKIHSSNEVVRRFSVTLHSNDPLARALALRELGALAVLTAEKVSVQQSVRQALEAHDRVEVEAAIFAARCLSAHNTEFAGSLVDKLRAGVNGISMSPDMQVDLLPTLQHVRTQHEAEEAKHLCVQLLTEQSTRQQAVAAIQALSQLACGYIVYISEHVSILLSVLENDARQQVCLAVFAALDRMACRAAHLWQPEHFRALWDYLGKSSSSCLSAAGLIVMNSLAWSAVGDSVIGADTYPVCQSLCCSMDCTVAALACGVASGVALAVAHRPDSDSSEWVMDAVCAVQTVLAVVSILRGDEFERHRRGVQLVLSCTVKLAKAYPSFSADLLQTLVDSLATAAPDHAPLFCQGLQRMVAVCNATTIEQIIPAAIPVLEGLASHGPNDQGSEEMAVMVCDLLLCCTSVDNRLLDEVLKLLEDRKQSWALFSIARCAAQRGVFPLASRLFAELSAVVCDEQHVRWLAGLADLCTAESNLSRIEQRSPGTTVSTVLSECNRCLHQAAIQFSIAKGSAGRQATERVDFVTQHCHLRSNMLTAIQQVVTCGNAMKCSGSFLPSIRSEMGRCVDSLRSVSQDYSSLYQSAFNADPQSLQCLRCAAHLCDFLVDSCSALYLGADLRVVQSSAEDDSIHRLRSALQELLSSASTPLSVNECFSAVHDVILQLLSTSVRLPPFVFNDRQGTRVQIALWPTPKGQGQEEHISVPARTHLVLKVEGAVQHEGTVTYRQIDMVHIRVTAERSQSSTSGKATCERSESCTPQVKSFKAEGGAFSSEFLLQLVPDASATHNVSVQVSVSDREGAVWTTGPKKSVRVIVDDLAPAVLTREALLS